MPEASSSPNPPESVLGTVKNTVLAMAVDSPMLTGVLNRFGIVDLKGADEMFVRLSDTAELNRDIQTLKTDTQFAKVYDELEAKAKAALDKGELDDLLNAFKGKTLSNGKTLDDKTVKENLAKTIAYVSVNKIKENIPNKWALMGESLGDIWEKSSTGLEGKSFSNQPLEYIVELAKAAFNTVVGVVSGPGLLTNAENIAKTKAFNERDKITLHVGGELAARGIMGPISSAVMVEMYDQLGQRSNPPRAPLTQQEREDLAVKFGKKLVDNQRDKVREGTGELRQESATAAADQKVTPAEKERTWYQKTADYFAGDGEFKNGQGVKGSIYDTTREDMMQYGLKWFDVEKTAWSMNLALTQKGELQAIQEGFAKGNPDVIVTFHDGKTGKPFSLAEYKDKDLPDSVLIGISPKKGENPDFYYLRTPGFSTGNASILAVDGAKSLAVTGAAILAAPEAAVIGTVGWIGRTAQVAWRGAKIAGLSGLGHSSLDATSKILSGGNVTDAELGEAFKQSTTDVALAGVGSKVLSKIPTEKLGEMLKTVLKGEKFSKDTIEVITKDGEKIVLNQSTTAALIEKMREFVDINNLKALVAENKLKLIGVSAITAPPAVATAVENITSPKPKEESTPNGATVPAPPPTPSVAREAAPPAIPQIH